MTINRTHIAMALSTVLLLGACAPIAEIHRRARRQSS